MSQPQFPARVIFLEKKTRISYTKCLNLGYILINLLYKINSYEKTFCRISTKRSLSIFFLTLFSKYTSPAYIIQVNCWKIAKFPVIAVCSKQLSTERITVLRLLHLYMGTDMVMQF